MAWIKRNLFFFIGGLIALSLLGTAGFYNYTTWSRNSEKFDKLNEIYTTLKGLNDPKTSPGNDKINKTQQAKEQEKQLRDLLVKCKGYFQPISPIPPSTAANPVTSENFAAALRRTIDVLQHEAETANVELPLNGVAQNGSAQKYGFSFEAERTLVKFSPGSLELLAVQLGEVKNISEVLYGAGVNQFDGIQRVHVSDDDTTGPQSDYITDQAVTNDLAIITPYMVTFRSFGPEIARVFAGFAASPHGYVIKSINVVPAGAAGGMPGGMAGGMPGGMPGGPANPYGGGEQMPQPMAGGIPGKGGLVTILNEQLLKVTMEIEIIKLQPKN